MSLERRRQLVTVLEKVAALAVGSAWLTILYLVLRYDSQSLMRLIEGASIFGVILAGFSIAVWPIGMLIINHNPLFVLWAYALPLGINLVAANLDPDPRASTIAVDGLSHERPRSTKSGDNYRFPYRIGMLIYKGQRVWTCSAHRHDNESGALHCAKRERDRYRRGELTLPAGSPSSL